MNRQALRDRAAQIPWLRSLGRAFWQCSRELPRRIPLQHLPLFREWSGRPTGHYGTVAEYLQAHPQHGWQRVLRAGSSYARVPPLALAGPLPACFDRSARVSWPDERLVQLAQVRYWGGYGGSLITQDHRILAELSPDVWGIERHALYNRFKLPKPMRLAGLTAVMSTPEADTNYSHWLIDLIPRLLLLHEAGFGPEKVDRYLVNPGRAPFYRETLGLLGIPPERVIAVDATTHFLCESIVTISLRPAHWQDTLPAWVPGALQRLTLRSTAPGTGTRRLYLTRRRCPFRRVLNEEALLPALSSAGFDVVEPDRFTVCEQAQLFHDAAVIVSPTSAALTNVAFCRPGAQVFEIHAPDFADRAYWTVSTAAGCQYTAAVGTRAGGAPARTIIEGRRQDLIVSPDLLAALLRAISHPPPPVTGNSLSP